MIPVALNPSAVNVESLTMKLILHMLYDCADITYICTCNRMNNLIYIAFQLIIESICISAITVFLSGSGISICLFDVGILGIDLCDNLVRLLRQICGLKQILIRRAELCISLQIAYPLLHEALSIATKLIEHLTTPLHSLGIDSIQSLVEHTLQLLPHILEELGYLVNHTLNLTFLIDHLGLILLKESKLLNSNLHHHSIEIRLRCFSYMKYHFIKGSITRNYVYTVNSLKEVLFGCSTCILSVYHNIFFLLP